jgi:hypothetical protein
MKQINQLREKRITEESYYEVPEGTTNAIQCKQGNNTNKWFIILHELETRDDIEPNDGEVYIVTHLRPEVFEELIEVIPIFSLEQHKIETETLVDEFVDNTYTALWYSSKGDISLVALDENSRWKEEAIQLAKWINNIYAILEDYKNTVTEENYQNIQEFINNLPKFNI